nr:unnamed protein product [Callosobruchus chinensis]
MEGVWQNRPCTQEKTTKEIVDVIRNHHDDYNKFRETGDRARPETVYVKAQEVEGNPVWGEDQEDDIAMCAEPGQRYYRKISKIFRLSLRQNEASKQFGKAETPQIISQIYATIVAADWISYAQLLTKVKEEVKMNKLGVTVNRDMQTRKGELLVIIPTEGGGAERPRVVISKISVARIKAYAGVDKKLARREERARIRAIEIENHRAKAIPSTSSMTDELFPDDSSSDCSEFAESDKNIPVMVKKSEMETSGPVMRKDLITPKLVAALDRCQLSIRNSVYILEATLEALGLNVDEYPIREYVLKREKNAQKQ